MCRNFYNLLIIYIYFWILNWSKNGPSEIGKKFHGVKMMEWWNAGILVLKGYNPFNFIRQSRRWAPFINYGIIPAPIIPLFHHSPAGSGKSEAD